MKVDFIITSFNKNRQSNEEVCMPKCQYQCEEPSCAQNCQPKYLHLRFLPMSIGFRSRLNSSFLIRFSPKVKQFDCIIQLNHLMNWLLTLSHELINYWLIILTIIWRCDIPKCQTRCPDADYSQCKINCAEPHCALYGNN